VDEVDQLLGSNEAHDTTLYQVFQMPEQHRNLIVIGVSNALDLTDRCLPLLAQRGCTCQVGAGTDAKARVQEGMPLMLVGRRTGHHSLRLVLVAAAA